MHEPSTPSSDLKAVKLAPRTNPWWVFLALGVPVLFLVAGALDALGSSRFLDMQLTLILLGVWAAFGSTLTVARATRRVGVWVIGGALAGAVLSPLVFLVTVSIGLSSAF